MKIAFFYKPSFIKVYSFFILLPFVAGTPLIASASFFSDMTTTVFGVRAQADEIDTPNNSIQNSQTMPLLAFEPSINPDLKNTNEPKDMVIVHDDSVIYSDVLSTESIKFEKSILSDQIMVYTVKEGDTLSEIADSFGISTNTIIWENNISGKKITIGQKLNILPMTGVKHIVKKGDTVSKIADKYEADPEDILIFNDLSKGDALKQGDIILVPNGILKEVVAKKPTSSSSSSGSIKSIEGSNTKVQSGYYLRPASGIITSPYGSRKGGFHPGVDIGNVRGTTVDAAADGVVTEVISGCVEGRASCGGGYGNHILIQHANGTLTRYAHLSKTNVNIGQDVSEGEKIGAIGNTGSSTGPHLHFEIQNANGSKMRPPF